MKYHYIFRDNEKEEAKIKCFNINNNNKHCIFISIISIISNFKKPKINNNVIFFLLYYKHRYIEKVILITL